MRKIIYIGLAFISLITGAYLGRMYAEFHSQRTNGDEKNTETSAQKSVLREVSLNINAYSSPNSVQKSNIQESIVAAMSYDSSMQKRVLLYKILKQVSQDDLVSLTEDLVNVKNISEEDKSLILIMIFSRMAEISPEFSIEFSLDVLGKITLPLNNQIVMETIFTIWAKNAPEEAFEFIKTNSNWRSDYFALLFRDWSSKDFSVALLAAEGLSKNSLEAARGLLNGSHYSSDFSQLLPNILAQGDEGLKTQFFNRWAFFDPISAAEWIENNIEIDEVKNLKKSMLLSLINEDFLYAMNWYFTNTTDKFSNPSFQNSNFYSFITPQQYPRVFDWLLIQDQKYLTSSWDWLVKLEYHISTEAVKHDVDTVKRYVSQLTDRKRESEIRLIIYQALAKQNSQKAKVFLNETALASDKHFLSGVAAIDRKLNTPCVGYCS